MWLAEVPSALVNACAVMLPRLEAEESILASNRVAMGSGRMNNEQDAVRLAAEWQRATTGDQGVAGKRRPDPEQLRARGFGVRRVRRPQKAS